MTETVIYYVDTPNDKNLKLNLRLDLTMGDHATTVIEHSKSPHDSASFIKYNNITGSLGLWECYKPSTHANATLAKRLEELMQDYMDLQTEHETLRSRYKALHDRYAHLERTETKHKHDSKELPNNGTKLLSDGNRFLIVIIDGNNLTFEENLLRAGAKGGRQAAERLLTSILTWWSKHSKDYPSENKLSVRVFVDAKGTANSYYRAGIVGSPSVVGEFLEGFCHYNALFDIVDVGEEADIGVKINALLDLHLRDVPCRQIFLGFNENLAYSRMLQYISREYDAWSRVTLLKGASTPSIARLPFREICVSGVFKRHSKDITGSRSTVDLSIGSKSCSRRDSIVSLGVCSGRPAEHQSSAGNWSEVASKAAALPFKDMTRYMTSMKPNNPFIMQNKNGQRLDAPIGFNYERVTRLKKKKYCNQHYIGKGCCHWVARNGACPHLHEPKLSNDDLKWLRVVARETVCRKGTKCVDFGCIYGHHCPYPREGKSCSNGAACRFPPQMHGMDTKVSKYVSG